MSEWLAPRWGHTVGSSHANMAVYFCLDTCMHLVQKKEVKDSHMTTRFISHNTSGSHFMTLLKVPACVRKQTRRYSNDPHHPWWLGGVKYD